MDFSDILDEVRRCLATGSDGATSAFLQQLITRVTSALEAASAAVGEIKAARSSVLATADDVMLEGYDNDLRQAARTHDRLEAGLAALHDLVEGVTTREAAEAKATAVGEAEAMKARTIKRLAEYEKHARAIVDILREYQASEAACKAAGVRTIQDELRFLPGYEEPAKEVTVDVSRKIPGTGPINPEYRTVQEMQTVRGDIIDPVGLPPLPDTVILPQLRIGDTAFWCMDQDQRRKLHPTQRRTKPYC